MPPETKDTAGLVHVVRHPVLQRSLTVLRDRTTESPKFRDELRRAARVLAIESTRDLETEPCPIETPLCPTTGHRFARGLVLVPVLRAGLGLLDAFLELVPHACVGFVGLRRDELTLESHTYLRNIPGESGAEAVILDPMLATGGSALQAIQATEAAGFRRLRLVSLLSAPEGIARVQAGRPDVPIFTGAIDERLNEKGYIVPGLGDAGDRQFGG